MVKFTRDSRVYHIVVSKLISIMSLLPTSDPGANDSSQSQDQSELYSTSSSSVKTPARTSQTPMKSILRGIV
jgi:hypothetical protein